MRAAERHVRRVVVEVGAGLNMRFERVDNDAPLRRGCMNRDPKIAASRPAFLAVRVQVLGAAIIVNSGAGRKPEIDQISIWMAKKSIRSPVIRLSHSTAA